VLLHRRKTQKKHPNNTYIKKNHGYTVHLRSAICLSIHGLYHGQCHVRWCVVGCSDECGERVHTFPTFVLTFSNRNIVFFFFFLFEYTTAPVRDLREALVDGSLGALNPFPWAICTGNCIGWVVYGYYTRDPFVVAANVPGLVLTIWLNSGAAKLQYLSRMEAKRRRDLWDASSPMEETQEVSMLVNELNDDIFVMVPQEKILMRVLSVWAVICVYVGWFSRSDPATTVGVLVNLNLIYFYGAPLQAMNTVIATNNSESIHVPTMMMNWLNTSFWISYGIARKDLVIILPNSMGLLLGLAQGALKYYYPTRHDAERESVPVLSATADDESDHASPEEELPGILSGIPVRGDAS
jgi:solute carrier family 50 protein (sugar transporter)